MVFWIWFITASTVESRIFLEYNKGKSTRISSVPITHYYYCTSTDTTQPRRTIQNSKWYRSVSCLLCRLPREAADKDFDHVVGCWLFDWFVFFFLEASQAREAKEGTKDKTKSHKKRRRLHSQRNTEDRRHHQKTANSNTETWDRSIYYYYYNNGGNLSPFLQQHVDTLELSYTWHGMDRNRNVHVLTPHINWGNCGIKLYV